MLRHFCISSAAAPRITKNPLLPHLPTSTDHHLRRKNKREAFLKVQNFKNPLWGKEGPWKLLVRPTSIVMFVGCGEEASEDRWRPCSRRMRPRRNSEYGGWNQGIRSQKTRHGWWAAQVLVSLCRLCLSQCFKFQPFFFFLVYFIIFPSSGIRWNRKRGEHRIGICFFFSLEKD